MKIPKEKGQNLVELAIGFALVLIVIGAIIVLWNTYYNRNSPIKAPEINLPNSSAPATTISIASPVPYPVFQLDPNDQNFDLSNAANLKIKQAAETEINIVALNIQNNNPSAIIHDGVVANTKGVYTWVVSSNELYCNIQLYYWKPDRPENPFAEWIKEKKGPCDPDYVTNTIEDFAEFLKDKIELTKTRITAIYEKNIFNQFRWP